MKYERAYIKLKHFPGHAADSKADTHLGVADVTNTWEERRTETYNLITRSIRVMLMRSDDLSPL